MVCPIVCAPAITLLAWISDKIGLDHGVTGMFIGALVVWFAEQQSTWLFKMQRKKGKNIYFLFKLQL